MRHPPLAHSMPVLVKSLHEDHRRALLDHFLKLDGDDRYLRFGRPMPDEAIAQYVEHIDWQRDTVFGVFDDALSIVGVAHLGVAPEGVEFGVSVLPHARGVGVGTRLFERAVLHARNHGIGTFTMQCLAWNAHMMHLALKAGMQVHIEAGEAAATLTLPDGDWRQQIEEAFEEQCAALDLGMKQRARAANDVIDTLARAFRPAA